jgi:hypothetical protein
VWETSSSAAQRVTPSAAVGNGGAFGENMQEGVDWSESRDWSHEFHQKMLAEAVRASADAGIDNGLNLFLGTQIFEASTAYKCVSDETLAAAAAARDPGIRGNPPYGGDGARAFA